MRRERVILFVIGALALFCGWIVWNYFSTSGLEYDEQRIPSPALLFDEYLVAERFLREKDVRASRRSTLPSDSQLRGSGAVFIFGDSGRIRPEDIRRLLHWVKQGGHLIVSAQNSDVIYGQRFLQGLGIERRSGERKKKENTEGCPNDPGNICIDVNGIPAKIRFQTSGLVFDPDEVDSEWDIPAPFIRKPHQIRFRMGEGVITVIPDSSPWENLHIAADDHAFILQKWMDGFDKVFLLTKPKPPGFFAMIWQNASEAVLASLLLLALWLVYRGRCFGPRRDLPAPARRSLVEYLHAASLFRWKHKQNDFLLEQARRPLKDRILRRYPENALLDEIAQTELLAKRTGLPARDIHMALYEKASKNKNHLRNIASNIQILWKNI